MKEIHQMKLNKSSITKIFTPWGRRNKDYLGKTAAVEMALTILRGRSHQDERQVGTVTDDGVTHIWEIDRPTQTIRKLKPERITYDFSNDTTEY